MYRDTGVLVVILASVAILIVWLVSCFLWNCSCCECCVDCRRKECRNPIAARPSLITNPRASLALTRLSIY